MHFLVNEDIASLRHYDRAPFLWAPIVGSAVDLLFSSYFFITGRLIRYNQRTEEFKENQTGGA